MDCKGDFIEKDSCKVTECPGKISGLETKWPCALFQKIFFVEQKPARNSVVIAWFWLQVQFTICTSNRTFMKVILEISPTRELPEV